MCIATGNTCGPATADCPGCRGRTCCSGLCALDKCVEDNVGGGTCPTGCGGDPQGTWRLIGACNASYCSGDKEAAVASKQESWVVSATAGTSLDWTYSLYCGGGKFSSGGNTIDGTWSSSASTIGGRPYCVRLSGSRLWLMPGDSFSLEFERVP